MLEFATRQDENELKAIWKIVFKDTDFFTNLYFLHYFEPYNTLVFRDRNRIVAMLFMRPYDFRFCGTIVQCYYLSGLATLPEYRRKGIMYQLINFSYKVMKERKIPLAILIPVNQKMYAYYRKFNYEQVFESDNEIIPLESLVNSNRTLSDAYAEFDKIYREKNFCIQKEFIDFQAIIADWEYDARPPKTAVAGMVQLIAPHFLFNIFRQKTRNTLKLNFIKIDKIIIEENVLTTSNRMLCRLLFGYKINELSPDITAIFPENKPILNLMLE
ncbi:MAG: GNAT family N-acetyltransferase [Prevotellaceae bacterium]|jgi:GNAT superfamily N-acetyltransferase|nr:GNAT family N-acetyltransferase [Prevotellaceae bacterium]